MKSQKNIYDYMYKHIGDAAAGKVVLELATGPGLIANHIKDGGLLFCPTYIKPDYQAFRVCRHQPFGSGNHFALLSFFIVPATIMSPKMNEAMSAVG